MFCPEEINEIMNPLQVCDGVAVSKDNVTLETVDVGGTDILLHLPSCNVTSPTKSAKKHWMKLNLLRRF